MLPSYVKRKACDNPKKFEVILQKKKNLYKNSFHALDEFFELQKKVNSIYDLDRHMKNLACMFPFFYYYYFFLFTYLYHLIVCTYN
jgi:hypothetical protein